MADTFPKFASAFSAATEADWRALAEKALRGKTVEEALVWRSDEGVAAKALATAADVPEELAKGGHWTRADGEFWDLRQPALHPDPAVANGEILADLAGGAGSAAIYLNHGSAGGALAPSGLLIRSLADLETALDGVYLDMAGLSLVAGPLAFPLAAALAALWQKRGMDAGSVRAAFNIDPLADLAAIGTVSGGLEAALERMAAVAVYADKTWPGVRAVAVTSHPYHGAGCGEAQEVAVTLASGVAYLRALEAVGLTPAAAARQIQFRLSADADVFMTIAKFRALRRLWARVLEACGVDAAAPALVEATTAPRMFAAKDPWSNIVRMTAATFAAVAGGADAVTVLPHTLAVGLPGASARRVARNVQTVLAEEAGIGRVLDPAAGAWAVESLVAGLGEAAWGLFQRIEGGGGIAAALADGWLQTEIGAVAAKRRAALEEGDEILVGINEFVDGVEREVEIETADLAALEAGAPKPGEDLSGASFGKAVAAILDGAPLAAFVSPAEQGGAGISPLRSERLAAPFEAPKEGRRAS